LEIIPVMDLMDGVVRVAGREEYHRPSQLADARPLTVARAFRDKLQLHRIIWPIWMEFNMAVLGMTFTVRSLPKD
jgi:hypothetical protein